MQNVGSWLLVFSAVHHAPGGEGLQNVRELVICLAVVFLVILYRTAKGISTRSASKDGKYCTSCGETNESDVSFCRKCGRRF